MMNLYEYHTNKLAMYDEKYPLILTIYKLNSLSAHFLTDEDKVLLSNNISYMLKTPELAYKYAKYVYNPYLDISNALVWPDLEPIISQDPKYASLYAEHILKNRWKEFEHVVLQDAFWSFMYALNVINGRWPEAEPIIMQEPSTAYRYAGSVIKDRWPEAEKYISNNHYWWEAYYVKFML